MLARTPQARRFQLILIKPSHYDDDGYVLQWLRSYIPSNSLAAVRTLAEDVARRRVLGADVEVDIIALDETNTRVNTRALLARLRRHGGFGLVGLVGVQSNQFPRALDLAGVFRAAGAPVVIGGFHVSGCLAMLPGVQPDLKAALDLGCTLFAGEAEGRMEQVLADAAAGRLQPIYNVLADLPALEGAPTPHLPRRAVRRTIGSYASFDAGRGCPFQCSFCTIINVQGRKSRYRSPDDVEQLVRQHWAEGIRHFFITDDNFARNKNWEAIFDRLILLREHGRINLKLIIQVDTLCHRIPNFVAKAARAGVIRVFIGLENINPANLQAAKKRQNKITEYRAMLLAWKRAGVMTYAGYILGFPADTPASIREDIEIIKNELPLDLLEFFVLTPLPGSEDHKVLWQQGAWMDPDLNNYDLEHPVAEHANMSRQQLAEVYRSAWAAYYTPDHVERILRRAAATGTGLSRLVVQLLLFSNYVAVENTHPLQGGLVRLKYRRDRRPGLPREPVWSFYPRYWGEGAGKVARHLALWLRLELLRRRVAKEQQRTPYTDQALAPVAEDETDVLQLFTHNESAREAVLHTRKIAALTGH